MNLIRKYYYLIYKFYFLFESFEQTRRFTQSKALMCVGLLELGLYLSFVNYRDVLFHLNSSLGGYTIAFLFFIILVKLLILIKRKKWAKYVTIFNSLPKDTNVKGTWFVTIITIIIIVNFIVSCILFSPLRGLSNSTF
ncbi:preprotein translocase subunit SecG [Mucilaginibacter sp. SG538B]|nr:preprotein translocase subunit SecG [Mucilaginibacter sp. SG538B]SCW74539.1 hypothetical protein SAMN03159284_03720 [Mucilaginibacter sp. NFR10]